MTDVRSKVKLIHPETDFVLRHADGTYTLVEIERPDRHVFTLKGEFSQEFNHACQQVEQWQGYVSENVRTVRDDYDLPGIDPNPRGIVFVGRASDFDRLTGRPKREARNRWRRKKHSNLMPYTFDEVCDRVIALANQLDAIGG